MELLKKDLENKKRLLKEAALIHPNKKYLKYTEITDILENNQHSLNDNQKQVIKEKNDIKFIKPLQHKDYKQEQDQNHHKSNSVNENEISLSIQVKIPHRKEVIAQLRQRDQPIRLFSETDYEAYQRLKSIEMIKPELDKGFRNDFQIALEKSDQDIDNSLDGHTNKIKMTANDVKVSEDSTTIDDILKMSKELGKGSTDLDSAIILKYLKFILKCWARELNARPLQVKSTVKGKMASAQHTQTRTYLKPLFIRLKRRSLQSDILESLTEIVRYALAREYIKANECYLQMAIGNAPWPIGVTMPGIHVRTGRERIASKHVAHVLNDETQRKYVQGLKRILTANQRLFIADPSKCIEYGGI
ncbi:unnamed protein product [Gordionus sp. m RMFG-2023]|uniref:pre-mRNA-splicing factor 18-like n=1 Tax=Gordionus sp. m RMFG-2023 TaxID=3053472 RepID=UPI0030E26D75